MLVPKKRFSILCTKKIDTHYLPLDLNNIYIIYLYYIYIIEKKTGKPVGCVYKRFTIYCTFLGALPDMFLRLQLILLSFSILRGFTSVNIVQGVKSCSWIFLYGEIVVTLQQNKRRAPPFSNPFPVRGLQVRFTSVPSPFQVRSLYRRYMPHDREFARQFCRLLSNRGKRQSIYIQTYDKHHLQQTAQVVEFTLIYWQFTFSKRNLPSKLLHASGVLSKQKSRTRLIGYSSFHILYTLLFTLYSIYAFTSATGASSSLIFLPSVR